MCYHNGRGLLTLRAKATPTCSRTGLASMNDPNHHPEDRRLLEDAQPLAKLRLARNMGFKSRVNPPYFSYASSVLP